MTPPRHRICCRGASESRATTSDVLQSTIAELTTESRASLLRKLAAAIHRDEAIARQFHTRLFQPQQKQIARRVAADGYTNPKTVTELLLAPLLYRWFLRLPQFTDSELYDHVEKADGIHLAT